MLYNNSTSGSYPTGWKANSNQIFTFVWLIRTYTHTIGYYLRRKAEEILTHATTWMTLEGIALSGVTDTEPTLKLPSPSRDSGA